MKITTTVKKCFSILLITILTAVLTASPVFAAYENLEDFTFPDTGVLFKFDGNADDAFGNLNGVMKGNITFTDGRDGTKNGAAVFDETDDFIELLKNDYAGDWTANFWVKKMENTQYSFLLMSMSYSVRLDQGGTDGCTGVSLHGVVDEITDIQVAIDEWTMLTFVHSQADSLVNIYINGEYMSGIFTTMPLPLTLLGNDSPDIKGWQSPLMAALDDVWLFGRAISESDITTLYKTGTVTGITLPGAAADEAAANTETTQVTDPQITAPEQNIPESTVTSAPQTSDFSALILALGVAVSALGVCLSGKKKSKI